MQTLVIDALNKLLSLDKETQTRLTQFAGKRVLLSLATPQLDLALVITETGVALDSESEATPDASIRGSLMGFTQLHFAPGDHTPLYNKSVQITGDLPLAQNIQKLLRSYAVDWEGLLATVTGDLAAAEVGRITRRGSQWVKHALTTNKQNSGEYLQEECRLLPCREEISDFCSDVDSLRDTFERLQARLAHAQTIG